jgi:hypothetical protein
MAYRVHPSRKDIFCSIDKLVMLMALANGTLVTIMHDCQEENLKNLHKGPLLLVFLCHENDV